MDKNVAIIGASGAIGSAFVEHYSNDQSVKNVYAFSRKKQSYGNKKVQSFELDIENQNSIQDAAEKVKENRLTHIIVATGILHSENFGPEKSSILLIVFIFGNGTHFKQLPVAFQLSICQIISSLFFLKINAVIPVIQLGN